MTSQSFKVFICLLLGTLCLNAQDLTEEQKDRLKYKVDLFSYDERDRMQLWFEDRMDAMKLKGEPRDTYLNIILYHVYKMKQLENQEPPLSDGEIRSQFQNQIDRMNLDIQELLTNEQFVVHKESWDALVRAVYRKKNWEPFN